MRTNDGRPLAFRNSNGLVKDDAWHIDVSKTGYISEAGRCLVMQARIGAKPVIIVLLDSWGKYTRIGDANRIKKWMESPLAQSRAGLITAFTAGARPRRTRICRAVSAAVQAAHATERPLRLPRSQARRRVIPATTS